jgi:hypothetical protein
MAWVQACGLTWDSFIEKNSRPSGYQIPAVRPPMSRPMASARRTQEPQNCPANS